MPTPFQHLVYAKQILESAFLPASIREVLSAAPGAYFFGSTAVDVQSLTGQRRVETHFYRVSHFVTPVAAENFFSSYPALREPNTLSPQLAAFISGYLVHLAWDEVWARNVFIPFYGEAGHRPDPLAWFVHHNALRVYCDRRAEALLRAWPEALPFMREAAPRNWLPFVSDVALLQWRDWLIEQLEDPGKVQTAHVFAQRMGISIARLESVVNAITEGIQILPVEGLESALKHFEADGLALSLDYLVRYWNSPAEVGFFWHTKPAGCVACLEYE